MPIHVLIVFGWVYIMDISTKQFLCLHTDFLLFLGVDGGGPSVWLRGNMVRKGAKNIQKIFCYRTLKFHSHTILRTLLKQTTKKQNFSIVRLFILFSIIKDVLFLFLIKLLENFFLLLLIDFGREFGNLMRLWVELRAWFAWYPNTFGRTRSFLTHFNLEWKMAKSFRILNIFEETECPFIDFIILDRICLQDWLNNANPQF